MQYSPISIFYIHLFFSVGFSDIVDPWLPEPAFSTSVYHGQVVFRFLHAALHHVQLITIYWVLRLFHGLRSTIVASRRICFELHFPSTLTSSYEIEKFSFCMFVIGRSSPSLLVRFQIDQVIVQRMIVRSMTELKRNYILSRSWSGTSGKNKMFFVPKLNAMNFAYLSFSTFFKYQQQHKSLDGLYSTVDFNSRLY